MVSINNERELRHAVERVVEGYRGPEHALNVASRIGHYAIGTARSQEYYEPNVPMTFKQSGEDERNPHWEPMHRTPGGGTIPVVRVSSAKIPTLWSAAGGDTNTPFQRRDVGLLLLSEHLDYDRGTHGWYLTKGGVALRGHTHLLDVIRGLPSGIPLGWIDIVQIPDADLIMPIDTPGLGQFAYPKPLERIAQIPVPAGAVHEAMARAALVESYYYEPLPRIR